MKPVSGKRMCKVLESRGWIHQTTKESHKMYEHPDFPGKISVPVHGNRDMRPGTQREIMRAAGLIDADL